MSDLAFVVGTLLPRIRELVLSARFATVRSVNTFQLLTNFDIGRLIVEHEQRGATRAGYGEALLKELAKSLATEFGKGFSKRNLEYMRKFYLTYRDRAAQIAQTPSAQFLESGKNRSMAAPLAKTPTVSAQSIMPFSLSWSHYVFLLSLENSQERSFYEIEAADQGWSLRELRRQFDASLYERLALSRDKKSVKHLGATGQVVAKPQDLLKNPYVLEFLGLGEKVHYSEYDLESAIIDKLEHFLLELGKGFLFEARQKRFTFDEEHFFVDLVFYNRLLRCYVLIDLKIGKLGHQDLGQMQMYVNYFDRFVRLEDEHPTVGIILCKKKNDALVEIILPEEASIYASEYRLYLPSKEELRQKLLDWTEDVGD